MNQYYLYAIINWRSKFSRYKMVIENENFQKKNIDDRKLEVEKKLINEIKGKKIENRCFLAKGSTWQIYLIFK